MLNHQQCKGLILGAWLYTVKCACVFVSMLAHKGHRSRGAQLTSLRQSRSSVLGDSLTTIIVVTTLRNVLSCDTPSWEFMEKNKHAQLCQRGEPFGNNLACLGISESSTGETAYFHRALNMNTATEFILLLSDIAMIVQ